MVSNNMPINYIEEDEIDLKELFTTILKYKYKIILFSFTITFLTFIYVLAKPNVYKSEVILAPQEQSKASIGGGLSALAGLAGVSLGGGNGMDAYTALSTILKDYNFNKMVIQKYHLDKKLNDPNLNKNYIFALGYRGIYDMLHSNKKQKIDDNILYNTYLTLTNIISLNQDKKSGLITLSVENSDRLLAKKLVVIYLKELTSYLREHDMKDVEEKLKYYENELSITQDVELKTQLSQLMSSLVQKKVLSKASEFYIVKKVTEPRIANIKEKIKPKRALILIVAMITSIILAIFGIFFIEFLNSEQSL